MMVAAMRNGRGTAAAQTYPVPSSLSVSLCLSVSLLLGSFVSRNDIPRVCVCECVSQ